MDNIETKMFHPTPAFVSHIHAAKEPTESIRKGDFQHITEMVPSKLKNFVHGETPSAPFCSFLREDGTQIRAASSCCFLLLSPLEGS